MRKELFLMVILLALEQCLATVCSEAPGVNGCSIPNWVPYKRKFTPACYKHDVCYSCGPDLDVSRLECDNKFRTNLRAMCSGWLCRRAADLYYASVRWFAGRFYTVSSHSWCNETWTSICVV